MSKDFLDKTYKAIIIKKKLKIKLTIKVCSPKVSIKKQDKANHKTFIKHASAEDPYPEHIKNSYNSLIKR